MSATLEKEWVLIKKIPAPEHIDIWNELEIRLKKIIESTLNKFHPYEFSSAKFRKLFLRKHHVLNLSQNRLLLR